MPASKEASIDLAHRYLCEKTWISGLALDAMTGNPDDALDCVDGFEVESDFRAVAVDDPVE